MNNRNERNEYTVSNEDEIVIIQKYYYISSINGKLRRKLGVKPILAFCNMYGNIYWYEDCNVVFLQEEDYKTYKVFKVDKRLINKVDNLYTEMANLMKKPINLTDPTDIIIEYSRRNKITKEIQKAIRRTMKLYFRCMESKK